MNEITVDRACRLKAFLDRVNLSGLTPRARLDIADLHGRLIDAHSMAQRAIKQVQREYAQKDEEGQPMQDAGGNVIFDDEEALQQEIQTIAKEQITVDPVPASVWQAWPNDLIAVLRPVLAA